MKSKFKSKPEYIACSAIWVDDGVVRRGLPANLTTGFVGCGLRHWNCLLAISEVYGFRRNGKYDEGYFDFKKVEGFLTSWDRFVDRIEGAKIAFERGQTDKLFDRLHSEDIY
jgi:hypothetical protein